jgi:diacylglycerol kinase family enzyme
VTGDAAAPGYRGGRGVVIVVNPAAGPAIGPGPAEILHERLPEASIIELADGDDVTEVLQRSAAGAAVLGVAGGDGTLNTAAGVAAARGIPMAVVPGGTLNHFARDLGIDDAEDAASAIEAGRVVDVDLGDIAGRSPGGTPASGWCSPC